MSASRKKKLGGVVPDMNVTPLVDVVLVLLIIFMVVAPQMEQDVQVELPGIFNPDPDVKVADPFKMSIDRAGEIYVEQEKMDLDGAIAVLSAKHAEEPLRRLVLRADSKLPYRTVREVLARTQQVGFPGLSLMVGERARPAGAGGPPSPPQPEAEPKNDEVALWR
jgi:biopolymer transport protein ExbD/biopolymer transport protein TolR